MLCDAGKKCRQPEREMFINKLSVTRKVKQKRLISARAKMREKKITRIEKKRRRIPLKKKTEKDREGRAKNKR